MMTEFSFLSEIHI